MSKIPPFPAGDVGRDVVGEAVAGDNDEVGTLDTDATGLVGAYILV